MIKVFIVDDEEWTRLSLREQVNWPSLGMEIIGEAKNGSAAMEAIKSEQPQIVISDIRMPVMDGISLMEFLHREYPSVIIIVISGYSEFEYARKALSFNAFEYLLKPIEEDKLEATLRRAASKLQEEKNNREQLLKLQIKLNESGVLAREKFLTSVIAGQDIGTKGIRRGLDRYGLYFEWPSMVVWVLKAENFDEIAAGYYKNDGDLASFALYNVANEQIGHERNSLVFRNYSKLDELIVITGFHPDESEEILESITVKCHSVLELVKKWLRFELYAGMGGEFIDFNEASASYQQAIQAIHSAAFLPHRRVIRIDEIRDQNDHYSFPADKEKRLLLSLENGHRQQAFDLIDELIRSIGSSRSFHPQSVKQTMMELKVSMNKLLKMHNGFLDRLLPESHLFHKMNEEMLTISKLEEGLKEAASCIIAYLSNVKKSGTKKTMDEIVNYVNEHYNEEMNLNTVAEQFYLNPAYLSRIFKQETGTNFSDYLSKVRIEAAARLLEYGNLKVSDISEMVGYESANYFMKKFKENFGCTPTEYRKKLETEK
ncbi:response regulator [Paenibacillus sp. P25]|nr:response regulator [Paenibacillus sp. P25]